MSTGCGLESQMLGIGPPNLRKLWNIFQRVPRSPQRDPRAPQRDPRAPQREPSGRISPPQGTQWQPKGSQGMLIIGAKVYIFPNSRSTAIGRPLLVYNIYIYIYIYILYECFCFVSAIANSQKQPTTAVYLFFTIWLLWAQAHLMGPGP